MTDVDLYKFFLKLINKEKTHVITPEVFNMLINVAAVDWVKLRLPVNEFTQQLIDEISFLHKYEFISAKEGAVNMFDLPEDYLHGNYAMFKLKYIDSPCFKDGESATHNVSNLLKSDRLSVVLSSHYLKPKDTRTYYYRIGNSLELFTGLNSGMSKTIGTECKLDYYRYPKIITFEENKVNELEMGKAQAISIAQLCAQAFLENNRDPRYQSFLNEQSVKQRI